MADSTPGSIASMLKRFEYAPGKKTQTQEPPNKVVKPQSPKKTARKKRGYAGPEKYAHLKPLVPLLQPGLRCVFIGYNPGTETALKGHYYAHHSNLFWKLIYESGCVDRQVTYNDDRLLPDEYGIGFTDLVARPTTGIEELSKEEMLDNVTELERKIESCEPQMICLVGKGIWDTIYKHKKSKAQKRSDFDWGLQKGAVVGGCTEVFVLPSTSGLVAGVSRDEKLRLWTQVAEHLNSRHPLKTE